MHILLTAATGFVGSALANHLLTTGHRITLLVRSPSKLAAPLKAKATCLTWQTGFQISETVLNDVDVVIHLAGESIFKKRWTAERKQELIDSRVKTTQSLIQSFQNSKITHKPKLFLCASAIGIYGSHPTELFTEASLISSKSSSDDFLAYLCEQWEQVAKEFPADRTVSLRFGLIFGKTGGFLKTITPLFKMGLGGKLGDGNQWMSWVHMKDILGIIDFIIQDKTISGAVNVVSPGAISNATFTKSFAKHLKRPAFLPVPKTALKIILGEMSEMALSGQNVKPGKLTEHGFSFQFPTLDEALKDLLN